MPGLKFASLPPKCGEKNQQQQEMGWKVEQGKEFIDFIKNLIGPQAVMWEAPTPVPKCLYLNHTKVFFSSRIFLPPISSKVNRLNLNNFPGPYVLPFNGRISLHLIKSRSFSFELNRCISIPRVKQSHKKW